MRVYYNEWDAKAAAWLRELIRQGLLPDGDVDERSILDVDPIDLWGYGQWHFFAGIGGWPLALQLAGLEGVEGIFTGSPPCQPFSPAGKLKGKDDERHLAPKFIDLVKAVRPRVLFGEQVASAAVFGKAAGSARSRAGKEPAWAWIDDLSDRLEAAHYAVGASDIPAAGVGAPHIRQRTFFGAVSIEGVDDASSSRPESEGFRPENEAWHEARMCGLERRCISGGLADRQISGRGEECADCRGVGPGDETQGNSARYESSGISCGLADTERSRPEIGLPETQGRHERDAEISRDDGYRRTGQGSGRPRIGGMGYATGESSKRDAGEVSAEESGEHGARVAEYGRVSVGPEHAGESVDGQPDLPGTSDGPWGDVDWLFCRDGKWRPVIGTHEPVVDGVPTRMVQGRNLFHPLTEGEEARTPRLKGYGNAIVPQAAAVFIESFMESLWWIR